MAGLFLKHSTTTYQMGVLGQERVQFEAALAALLAEYSGGAGSGSIPATRLNIINLVKAKLDEVIPEGEGLIFTLSSEANTTNPLDLLISALLDEASKNTLMMAPFHVLEPTISETTTGTADIVDELGETGYVELPENFLRLISFKMEEWERPVNIPILNTTMEYFMQKNKYVRGGVSKPAVALSWKYARERIITEHPAETVDHPAVTVDHPAETVDHPEIVETEYTPSLNGYLYNGPVITNNKNIAPEGWRVPTENDRTVLMTFLKGDGTYELSWYGGALKSTGTEWNAPNTGATNSSGFNGVPAGRWYNGAFEDKGDMGDYWLDDMPTGLRQMFLSTFTQHSQTNSIGSQSYGSIRLIKESSEGWQSGDYMVGNDGRRYITVKIGEQVWMAENLAETKYRNGDTIPLLTTTEDIADDTVGARCIYDNDSSNIGPIGDEIVIEEAYTEVITPAWTEVVSEAYTEVITPAWTEVEYGDSELKKVLEYYSLPVNAIHLIEHFLYIPETLAENVQSNLRDVLTWICAAKVLQITGQLDLSQKAMEQVALALNNL
jgi:uncharacterized protein (TIGR02145 family)